MDCSHANTFQPALRDPNHLAGDVMSVEVKAADMLVNLLEGAEALNGSFGLLHYLALQTLRPPRNVLHCRCLQHMQKLVLPNQQDMLVNVFEGAKALMLNDFFGLLHHLALQALRPPWNVLHFRCLQHRHKPALPKLHDMMANMLEGAEPLVLDDSFSLLHHLALQTLRLPRNLLHRRLQQG